MRTVRLIVYSIVVFSIQLLGRIATRCSPIIERWTVNDRVCYGPYETDPNFGDVVLVVCCDCGASHIMWKANKGIYGIPTRPLGYNYKPRLHVDTSLADVDSLQKQNHNR